MAKLTTIEGIADTLAEKLRRAGVGSVEALLKKGGTPSGRKEIAAKSGIDDRRILRFINHADLMRIKGIGAEYSELLEAAGVDTVVELAARTPENLHAKMVEVNAAKKLVRQLPTLEAVRDWKIQAQGLPRAVLYQETKVEELRPLSLVIDAGTASPEEIGDVLSELSKLYRMMGGSGITFTYSNVGVYEVAE